MATRNSASPTPPGDPADRRGDTRSQPPAPPPSVEPGTVVANFRIDQRIGAGGMGAVYRATDLVLGRTVALKLLSPSLAVRPEALARFQLEAKNAAFVNHDNVVQIYSFGIDAGVPYLAMEHLRGETLAERLQRGAMSVQAAADIALPLCSGVHAAHRKGILHRDLKPSNVFLAVRPTGEVPKLLDFGISKLQSDETELTAENVVVGTELYMAPERAYKAEVDGRADQYSLGVMLYQCVTGRHPHDGKGRFQIFRDAAAGSFDPPSRHVPDLPEEFERIVLRAMAALPDARFESMRALGQVLLPFASARARSQWTEHYEAPEGRVTLFPSAAELHRAVEQARTVSERRPDDGTTRDEHPTPPGATRTQPAGTLLLTAMQEAPAALPETRELDGPAEPSAPDGRGDSTGELLPRGPRTRVARLALAAAACVLVAAVAAWAMSRDGGRGQPERSAAARAGARAAADPEAPRPAAQAPAAPEAAPGGPAEQPPASATADTAPSAAARDRPVAGTGAAVPGQATRAPEPVAPGAAIQTGAVDQRAQEAKPRRRKKVFYTPEGVPVI